MKKNYVLMPFSSFSCLKQRFQFYHLFLSLNQSSNAPLFLFCIQPLLQSSFLFPIFILLFVFHTLIAIVMFSVVAGSQDLQFPLLLTASVCLLTCLFALATAVQLLILTASRSLYIYLFCQYLSCHFCERERSIFLFPSVCGIEWAVIQKTLSNISGFVP